MLIRLLYWDIQLRAIMPLVISIYLIKKVTTGVAIFGLFFTSHLGDISMIFKMNTTTLLIVFYTYNILSSCMMYILWSLAKKPTMKKLIMSVALVLAEQIVKVLTMFAMDKAMKFLDVTHPLFQAIWYIIIVIYNSNDVLVVVTFLKVYRNLRKGYWLQKPVLKRRQVSEFFRGTKCSCDMEKCFTHGRYDKSYELNKNRVKRCSDSSSGSILLGEGHYGSVFRGTYKMGGNAEDKDVAIKVYRNTQDEKNFQLMLREVKLMINIGHHENILPLFKVYTKRIALGNLMMLTPLCHLGSLESFLRKHGCNKDFIGNKHNSKQYCENVEYVLTESDLFKFSLQTAKAMEFLSLNKIVHGDLAARNILLTKEMTVKVTDFGLSHHLYNYKLYRRQLVDCELPWRWMAPESLQDLKFSVESDIWSFGVTLWEIFSFGQVPYDGIMWDSVFSLQLKAGLRLAKPLFSREAFYEEVMLRCWSTEENERLPFLQLSERIQSIYSESENEECVILKTQSEELAKYFYTAC